jgi:hypothetical protein
VNKKKQKKLFYAGSWALAATLPKAQHKRSFCAAFFQKAAAFSWEKQGLLNVPAWA